MRYSALLCVALLCGACARREQVQLRVTGGPSCVTGSAQDASHGLGPDALRRARAFRITLADDRGLERSICVAVQQQQDAAGVARELRAQLAGQSLLRGLAPGDYSITLLGTAASDCAAEAVACGQGIFSLPAGGPIDIELHCYDHAADSAQPPAGPPAAFAGCRNSAPADGGPPADGGAVDRGAVDRGPRPDGPSTPRYSFAVFGSSALDTSNCTAGVPERMAVPAAITASSPSFVLHTGDLMARGYAPGAYAQLVSCFGALLAKRPFFPTLGDYDAGSNGVLAYRSYLEEQLTVRNAAAHGAGYAADFVVTYGDDPTAYSTDFDHPAHLDVVPSGVSFKTFYAFRHANAYFVSLEVGTRWWINTPKPWLEKHLKAARDDATIEHVFVLLHHPLYSTTMDEQSVSECVAPVRAAYEPLLRQYDVTMVFSGHANLYDRFYVPDDGTATRRNPPPQTYAHDGKAVHYVVTGGGGDELNGCWWVQDKSYAYFQQRSCAYHFIHVQVEGHALQVATIRVTGDAASPTTTEIDRFSVQ